VAKNTLRHIGLARALSKLGVCSRSQAGELIRAGRVQVNGRVCRDPETPTACCDRILVDGKPAAAPTRVYIMLNKPRGLVTTRSDEKGRATIYDCLGGPHLPAAPMSAAGQSHAGKCGGLPWLAPVGRLDQASEGLLLLTNDSEWAARITDPAQHLDKIYHVQIDRVADEHLLRSVIDGVRTANDPAPKGRDMKARHGSAGEAVRHSRIHQSRRDGIQPELLRAKSARLLRHGAKNSWLEIALDEGRNRQIRRMLDALGVEVLRLVRVAIGPLQLGDLGKGAWRELTKEEKRAIDRALSG
jgi:23S rRNA pseudouridine2605 synthase